MKLHKLRECQPGSFYHRLKSIKPNRLAVRYPTIIPQKIGINLNIPRPNIEARIAVSRATSANSQFSFAIFTPESASERPIRIITGPITTGGKSRLIKRSPSTGPTNSLIHKRCPRPPSRTIVPGNPYNSVAFMIAPQKQNCFPEK